MSVSGLIHQDLLRVIKKYTGKKGYSSNVTSNAITVVAPTKDAQVNELVHSEV